MAINNTSSVPSSSAALESARIFNEVNKELIGQVDQPLSEVCAGFIEGKSKEIKSLEMLPHHIQVGRHAEQITAKEINNFLVQSGLITKMI